MTSQFPMKSYRNEASIYDEDDGGFAADILDSSSSSTNMRPLIGPLERELLRLVENGDVQIVQDFLQVQ